MGTYFNPGNASFKSDVRSRIYVDKTGLIEELNKMLGTSERCVALSHARRFGKSQAAGMIDAYYSLGSDSRELFSPFEISKAPDFEEHLNQYNVIHIDVSSAADFHTDDLVEYLVRCLFDEFKKDFPGLDYTKTISLVLKQIQETSGRRFVIIIDEWDCVVRNMSDRQDLVHKYLQFLHAIFKSEESKSYLALAYITGILPIKKIKDESALNNFREYTMLESDQLTRYFGFTDEEVQELCRQYDMDYESVKKWYDGYLIDGEHMYNPNSVYEAMVRHKLNSYWKNTSSFETINTLIALNMEGLKEDVLMMLEGGKVPVVTGGFKNDFSIIENKDQALTALIHLGYLGYDAERKQAFIPNFEVSLAFQAALTTGKWSEIAKTIARCDELLFATIDEDCDKVAELLELSHDAYTSLLKYNDENSLSCAITMAYFTAPAYYNVIRELPAGKGFADIALIPRADTRNKPPMIVELKWNQDADTAIKQIKERRYAGALKGFESEVLLVGVSYDKDSTDKKHSCVIETVQIS